MTPTSVTVRRRKLFRPPKTLATASTILIAALLALAGCEGPTGPQGPRGVGPVALTDPSILPRVMYTYPPVGMAGPYPALYVTECEPYQCPMFPVIRIRFNKNMDFNSLTDAIRLSSTSGNASITPGGIIPLGGDVFIVHPADSNGRRVTDYLGIGEQYLLSIDSTARDVNGNRLPAPFVLAYTPEPYFRIVGTTPADGATVTRSGTSLTISFNAPIDSSILGHLKIEPPAVMIADWYVDYNRRRVAAFARVEGSTAYTVTVDSGASDTLGHRLPAPFSFTFSGVPLGVSSILPRDGQTGVSPTTDIFLYFSEPVDTATVRGAFQFTPGVVYDFSSGDGRFVYIYPRTELQPNTAYTLVIDSSLRSKAGANLREPFTSTFTTGLIPSLAVSYSSPADGALRVDGRQSIQLSLNREIDTSSVPGAFHLEPARSGRFSYGSNRREIRYDPDVQLTMGERFELKLDTMLRAADGRHLAAPYHVSFVVRQLEVELMVPADGRPDVLPTERLTIHFSGIIDTATVRGALTIDPATPGALRAGSMGFDFVPMGAWMPEVTYTVRLDTTLRAEGGGGLATPFVSSFRTAPFAITGCVPADGFEGHLLTGPVWITCNDIVDTASATATLRMTDSAGTAVPGNFYFTSTTPDQFVFLPSAPLRPAEWYEVTVGTALRSAHGHAITTAFHRRFRTLP